jgi:hypothetical protein
MKRFALCATALLMSGLISIGAAKSQPLLPTPYPEMLGPNAMETPIPRQHYHQHLLPDAAPAAKGPNALGNPHTHHHYHQHLLREPYPRQWWRR